MPKNISYMVDRGKSKLCKAMDHINENKSVNLQINYENGIYLRSQTNVNIIENLITNRKNLFSSLLGHLT